MKKIALKFFNIYGNVRHAMCVRGTGPSHSVNAIRIAHNVVSHSESTHAVGPFRAPPPWSPNNRSVTDNCRNIMYHISDMNPWPSKSDLRI